MNEIESVALEIENLVRKNKLVYETDLNDLMSHLVEANKKKAMNLLKKKPYIKDVGGALQYDEEAERDYSTIKENICNSLIKPEFVNTEKDYTLVGGKYYRGLYCTGFPARVRVNWLSKLVSEKSNIDFSLHIRPSSVKALEVYLYQQLKRVDQDLYSYQQKGMANPSLEERREGYVRSIKDIARGRYKHYRVALYLISKGISPQKTITLSKKLKSSLQAEGLESEFATRYHEQLLKSIIPVGINYLPNKEILVPDDSLAASFPFSSSFLDIDEKDGTLLGFNDLGLPIAKYIFSEKNNNYSMLIAGGSGSGKSYATKSLLLQQMITNSVDKLYILDPQNEYGRLVEKLDGTIITLHRKSKSIPNLLDLYGGDFDEKLVSLTQIFGVLIGGEEKIITRAQKPLLEEAIIETYRRKGILKDDKETWSKQTPILSDLRDILKEHRRETTNKTKKNSYDVLIDGISRFCKGGIYSFMDQKGGELDIKSDLICFELLDIPSEVKRVLMLTTLEFIKNNVFRTKERKLVVIDEAWMLLQNDETSNYINSLVRTGRKYGTGLWLNTQTTDELLQSKVGRSVLANIFAKYIFKTEGVFQDDVTRLFMLNDVEKEAIGSANVGQGILVWGNQHYKINIKVNKELHKLITTTPAEIRRMEAEKRVGKKGNGRKTKTKSVKKAKKVKKPTKKPISKSDYSKLRFVVKDLTEDQVDDLRRRGYRSYMDSGFSKGRGTKVLIKSVKYEGSAHTCLLANLIDRIKQEAKTTKTKTYGLKLPQTKEADIIVTIKKKKYAFEVETGTHSKKDLDNKVKALNKKFGKKNWCFVLTKSDRKLMKKYEAYTKEVYTRMDIVKKIRKLFK